MSIILPTSAISRNENPESVYVPKDINATGAASGVAPSADPGLYVPKDIKPKRPRRTRAAIVAVRDAIKDILEESNPQTVRQVFYAPTVRGVIAKAEIEYKRTVVRLLTEMREAGEVPFEWIADNTRWQRRPSSFTGIETCLEATANSYRRNLWASMPVYIPTRPTKQTDTRGGSGTSVEVDAIPADKLRALVRGCIERHIDRGKLELLKKAEKSERELLRAWASTYAADAS
jgi:hypothetical protein